METQIIGVSLSRYAADRIIDLIASNGLQSGDRLPNEAELCATIGVSRGTLREAVKILNTDNVVTIRRGLGTFVSENPGVSADPFGFRFISDKQQLALDLIQIREILEPSLAALAAKNATKEEGEELFSIEQKLERCFSDGVDTVPDDIEFHSLIARMTHNHVVELIFPILAKTIPEITSYTKKALLRDSMDDHRRITEAIRNGDSESASSLMKAHLKRNKDYVLSCIGRDGE